MNLKTLIILIALLGFPWSIRAQSGWNDKGWSTYTDFKFDTNLVRSYEHLFGLELYLQNKDLNIVHQGQEGKPDLTFKPNTALSLGLGFTYRYLALSAAVNLTPLRSHDDLKTKSFDFQSQIAGARNLSFITAQFYKGFATEIGNVLGNITLPHPDQAIVSRPDMGITMLGLNNMYALNRRYSFRGSVLRFQRMRYSVGSPIAGVDGNLTIQSADSSFVPAVMNPTNFVGDRRHRNWNLGLGAGYAHTFVLGKHWLFAGIATVKLPLNFFKVTDQLGNTDNSLKGGINGNLWLRISYERDVWSVSLYYIQNRMLVGKTMGPSDLIYKNGMARLIFSRRFGISKKFKNTLKPVDVVLDIPRNVLSGHK